MMVMTLRECPNPKCRLCVEPFVLEMDRGQFHVICPLCSMLGPAGKTKAAAIWNYTKDLYSPIEPEGGNA